MNAEQLLAVLKEKAIINFNYKCRMQMVYDSEIELSIRVAHVKNFPLTLAGAEEAIQLYKQISK